MLRCYTTITIPIGKPVSPKQAKQSPQHAAVHGTFTTGTPTTPPQSLLTRAPQTVPFKSVLPEAISKAAKTQTQSTDPQSTALQSTALQSTAPQSTTP